jgi:hypothetical protein
MQVMAIIVNIQAFPTSAFILPGWVFKFYPMVYEKHITWTEKDGHEINSILWTKKESMHCVIKWNKFSSCLNVLKKFLGVFSYVHLHI